MGMWRCGNHTFALEHPLIMGIINVTPDSFSDGGLYDEDERAIQHGLRLLDAGADILDVGGESTRPGFTEVVPDEEISRVVPVIERLVAEGAIVSIDTRHAEVARAALDAGASIINDVTGFTDPAMREVALESDAGLVVVRNSATSHTNTTYHVGHMPCSDSPYRVTQTEPECQSTDCTTACGYISDMLSVLTGYDDIDSDRIVFDPGFGFVDTYEEDLALWSQLDHFTESSYPVLVGISRKRLVGRISGISDAAERDEASAQLAVAAIHHGTKIVRVHDVTTTVQALKSYESAQSVTSYVALGSNLGDRKAFLEEAVARIDTLPDTTVEAVSSFIETEALYVTDQPDFLNAAIRVRTKLPLFAFFTELQAIEVAMGRVKEYDKGPRTIDLDLLIFGDITYQTSALTIPHPLMHERGFVLEPLREVALVSKQR